ncbi:MAG: DNA polymerase IV [Euryarchaeota archaeon]|nr:DNA polymerase IV [Euryarchaeota archaeon]
MRRRRGRIVLHVDMDSFFSAIEQRENPELRGRPVVVGADPKGGRGRGVVSTASYEARRYGVRSGMPISQAYRLCPSCIFLPVRHELYWRVSKRIMQILRSYAAKFQQVSVDEAYLDVTGLVKSYGEAEKLARRIKAEIYEKEKLTCSIGIGPNKLVAKIASDHRKPDGLTVVPPGEVESFLAPLPVRKIPGIGPRSEALLKELGITTIGELAQCDVQRLIPLFGRWASRLVMLARGVDEREVRERSKVKSIGREQTFPRDLEEEEELRAALEELAERVHRDLKEEGFLFRTLTLKVRFSDFETHTRAKTLRSHHGDLATIKEVSQSLLSRFPPRKVRLLGIRLSKLKKRQAVTLDDFM